MINRIHKFIQKEELLQPDDKILLAVSGGIDSMCLLDIFKQLPYSIGVAHVNHLLRGEEANEDQVFVEDSCDRLNVPVHTIKLDIKAIAKADKRNVSDTGRTERYAFFSRICEEHGYTKIATAHHADDDIETVIMRFLEGSGLTGLSGIPLVNDMVIRPLLRLTRTEIVSYVRSQKISFREDSSNTSEDYFRNAVRHQLVPQMIKLKSSAPMGMIQSIDILKDSSQLLNTLVKSELQKRLVVDTQKIVLDIPTPNYKGRISLLYYALTPYGFTRSQVLNLASTTSSGSRFYAKEYQGLYNRGSFIISKKTKNTPLNKALIISSAGEFPINDAGTLALTICDNKEMLDDKFIEIVDADKISYPITLRHWTHGDSFKPLGMGGKSQSLQDFFTNEKLSIYDKEQVIILESEGSINWVIGHRISDHIKLSSQTKRYLKLEFRPNE